ncbi:MAG TPA: lipoprotein insertase outer membrane protein LolB [Thermomonas sp.]|nr:lipoprotein insertase outer membrane protein LolB [Thermomonas sp.]HQE08717.1 lipoprotein insertase outer membrane protein LolB [Thermomonas sp.]
MAGRMAISNGKDAGAARFEWTQGEGRLQLQLTAPITAQTWVLQSDTQGAQLQGMPQGSQHGADAATLLRTATGWDIPIQALGCWMRAVAASEFGLGAAQIHFDGQLLPRQIEQGGWKIEYSRWQLDPFSGLQMPSRIDAQRGKSRVKLAIDRWGLE